jgi:hypothetical protein
VATFGKTPPLPAVNITELAQFKVEVTFAHHATAATAF